MKPPPHHAKQPWQRLPTHGVFADVRLPDMNRRRSRGSKVAPSTQNDSRSDVGAFSSPAPQDDDANSHTPESPSCPRENFTRGAVFLSASHFRSQEDSPPPRILRGHRNHLKPSSQHARSSSNVAETPSPIFHTSGASSCRDEDTTPPYPGGRHIYRTPDLRGNASLSSQTARTTSAGFRCQEDKDIPDATIRCNDKLGPPHRVTAKRRELVPEPRFGTATPWSLSPLEKALPESPVTRPPVKQWPYSLSTKGPAKVAGLVDANCHLELIFSKAGHHGTYAQFRLEHRDTYPECYEGCVTSFCRPATFKQHFVWNSLLDEAGVWGAFGCHPHMVREYNRQVEESLLHALNHPSVVALGEVGLDYSKRGCDHELQQKVFRKQIGLALSRKLPLVIHSRDSTPDTISIMRELLPPDYPIHRHCFTGDWGEAQEWLQAFPNLCLGLTPLVTFRSVSDQPITEAARNIPLDRLLLETASPHFLPSKEARRLKCSHPGMAIHVATCLSSLKNVAVEEILTVTRENVRRIYGI